jgi:hypothetical protein
MRVYCYCVYTAQGRCDRIWDVIRDSGWISATVDPAITYYFIPDHLRAWCLLVDPSMRRLSEHDVYV